MQKIKLRDITGEAVKFSIVESTDVDGEHILAKVRGPFFVPDGASRNKRFYPRSLWEKVLSKEDVINKMENRTMFGTIGHDAILNDKGLREGLASHIITSAKIDESGMGIGEAYILNTPVGKVLNTYLRAGAGLNVSSRADGTFKGKKGDLSVVNEDTYDLQGWDFVLDAGFLQARPSIAEAFNEAFKEVLEDNNDDYNKEGTMDEVLIKHITNENASLKNTVSKLTDEVKLADDEKKSIQEDFEQAKKELDSANSELKVLESYKAYGSVDEVKAKLAKADEDRKVLEAFLELSDTPEKCKLALEKSDEFISTVHEEFGTVAQIAESLKLASDLKSEVDELGTVDEIKTVLGSYTKILEEKEEEEEKKKEEEMDKDAEELSKETGMKKEEVAEMLKTISKEDFKKIHCGIKESVKKSPYAKDFNKKDEEVNEDKDDKDTPFFAKSRIERINERFSEKVAK